MGTITIELIKHNRIVIKLADRDDSALIEKDEAIEMPINAMAHF